MRKKNMPAAAVDLCLRDDNAFRLCTVYCLRQWMVLQYLAPLAGVLVNISNDVFVAVQTHMIESHMAAVLDIDLFVCMALRYL